MGPSQSKKKKGPGGELKHESNKENKGRKNSVNPNRARKKREDAQKENRVSRETEGKTRPVWGHVGECYQCEKTSERGRTPWRASK